MNVLFFTSRFPYPPNRGDRLTVLNLIRTLSERHRVTLVSFTHGGEPAEAMERVCTWCHRVETVRLPAMRSWAQAWLGLPSAVPSQVSYYRSSEMHDLARRLLADGGYDVVFHHLIRMAPYGMDVPHPRKVLWLGDSLGLALGRSMPFEPWWKRPGIAWERRRIDGYQPRASARFRETWALSPIDREDLIRIGCRNVVLVTHGVDERLFELEPHLGPPRVVFLGNLSVPHNRDAATFAAREVWPRLRPHLPEGRLCIAGADPGPRVTALGEVEGVDVMGAVPDLRPLWESASVLLAPLRFSTGIQNKVLEAMAAGVPVVATRPVADGISARDGAHLLVADTPAELAAAVLRVHREPAESRARAARARAHVRARFRWDAPMRRLEWVASLPDRRSVPAVDVPERDTVLEQLGEEAVAAMR